MGTVHSFFEKIRFSLGDFYSTYVDRPLVMYLFVFLCALFVFWLITFFIRKVGQVLGGTALPAEGLVNQGPDVDASIENLNKQVADAINLLLHDFQQDFDQSYVAQVKNLKETLTAAKDKLADAFNANSDRNELRRAIFELENSAGESILSVYRRLSTRSKGSLVFQPIRNRFESAIERIINSYPNFYIVFQTNENLAFEPDDSLTVKIAKFIRRAQRSIERRISWSYHPLNRNGQKKTTKVRKIPWKSILKRRIESDLQMTIVEWVNGIDAHLNKIRSALKESARVLHFNLESAAIETTGSSTNPDMARQTALGSFDRVIARLNSAFEEAAEDWQKLRSTLSEESSRFINQVHRDCDVADTVGAIASGKLEDFSGSLQNAQDQIKKWFHVALKHVARAWIFLRDNFGLARAKLGLKPAETHDWIGALDNATVEFAQRNIPPLYKRVFRFDPLGDEEFFVSRDESLGYIRDAEKRWALGLPSSIGIYGPGGSGKTSLVTCAQQRFFQGSKVFVNTMERYPSDTNELIKQMVTHFQLKISIPPKDIEDLANLINKNVGPAVAIVEGANLLFTRSMNGFKIIDSFFDLVARTRPAILWIITMSEEAWRYLDAVKRISGYFTCVINARNMDREDLERVIMVRHEITGYELEFASQENHSNFFHWKKRKTPEEVQNNLRKRFFDDLHRATDGNLFASIYYWLCAAEFQGEEKVRIQVLKPLEMGAIRSLNHGQAACLVAALQQGMLWPETYTKIFRATPPQAAMCLNELREKSILLYRGHGEFVPNPIVIPNATRVLRERNLIHA